MTELRQAWRAVVGRPTTSLVIVSTLALGLGAVCGRLARLLLVESTVLARCGGALGARSWHWPA